MSCNLYKISVDPKTNNHYKWGMHQYSLPLVFNEDLGKPHVEQTEFWKPVTPILTKVENFFKRIDSCKEKDYKDYWASIQPKNANECFLRWVFAFLSVHTTWEANLHAFNNLKDCLWIGNEEELSKRLKDSRVGLHNNRTKFLSKFSTEFWSNPSSFIPSANDTKEVRDNLYKKVLGLGIAKTSFAIEMIKPIDAQVVCMDTHLFKFYGLDQTRHARLYRVIEDHWNKMCKIFGYAPYIVRCLFWDENQGKSDSRYWSICLEN